MIELHTMASAWRLPTFTPFGLKILTYMRLADIPFRTVVEHDPRRSPKGKLPWIRDGKRVIADSGFIVDYLAAEHGRLLDDWLTVRQRFLLHATRRMLEESLCFSILYFRWTDDRTFAEATSELFRGVPGPARWMLARLVRRRILRDLWGQGIGRHSREEVAKLGGDDLDALAGILGEKPYIMGEQPCSLDASAAAFLSVLLRVPLDNELAARAREHKNLVTYEARMAERCYPSSSEA